MDRDEAEGGEGEQRMKGVRLPHIHGDHRRHGGPDRPVQASRRLDRAVVSSSRFDRSELVRCRSLPRSWRRPRVRDRPGKISGLRSRSDRRRKPASSTKRKQMPSASPSYRDQVAESALLSAATSPDRSAAAVISADKAEEQAGELGVGKADHTVRSSGHPRRPPGQEARSQEQPSGGCRTAA